MMFWLIKKAQCIPKENVDVMLLFACHVTNIKIKNSNKTPIKVFAKYYASEKL